MVSHFEIDGRENLLVRFETDGASVFVGFTDNFQRGFDLTALMEADMEDLTLAIDEDVQPFAEGVRDGRADAVKSAGSRIGSAIEFSAGMQGGENQLDSGHMGLGMDIDRKAASFVLNLDGAVFMQDDGDGLAKAVDGFVFGVIDNLPNELVKAGRTGSLNIHAWAFANTFEFAQNLDVLCCIFLFCFNEIDHCFFIAQFACYYSKGEGGKRISFIG